MQRESFNLRLCRRKWLLLYMESRCFAARFAALSIFLFSQSHVLFLHCIQSTEVKAESERFLCERNAGVTDFFETRTLGFTLQTFSTKEIVTLIPVWCSRPWRLPKKSFVNVFDKLKSFSGKSQPIYDFYVVDVTNAPGLIHSRAREVKDRVGLATISLFALPLRTRAVINEDMFGLLHDLHVSVM